jgi:signal transduction histidine kinase
MRQGARAARAPLAIDPATVRVERRGDLRRAGDRAMFAALAFTGHASIILAGPGPAGDRLGELLVLIARTAGARRAALLIPGPVRRLAVAVVDGEPTDEALDLASWLDAAIPRPRHERATAGSAPVTLVTVRGPSAGVGRRPLTPIRRAVSGDSRDAVSIGLDFAGRAAADRLDDLLPPPVVRQATAMVAAAAACAAEERELVDLRRTAAELKRFVSTVAHELRTPLTAIGGYLAIIADDRVSEAADRDEFLERSRRIVDSMGELVNDLLEVAQIDSGTLDLDIGMVSLADILKTTRDEVAPIAAVNGVSLTVRPAARLRTAMGDRRRVAQVVVNLVGNAVKYTPAGGSVDVETAFDGLAGFVVVRDTGPGIPAGEQQRIFEPFARLDLHRTLPGTGLGLPIARELARLMGGDIGVASVDGRGATFILALPGPTSPPPVVVGEALQRVLDAERERIGALPGGGEDPASPPSAGPVTGVIHHRAGSSPTRG